MAAGYGYSRGVTLVPMTQTMRDFMLRGIRQQGEGVFPRLKEEDVAEVVSIPQFANTENLAVVNGDLNGRDVIIGYSYEPPIIPSIWDLELTMQAVNLAGADRITVLACYAPLSRGDKKDQHHGSISFKAFADKLNFYRAGLLTFDLHSPVTLGFFDYPSRMLSLRNVMMGKIRELGVDFDVLVSTDVGWAKTVWKWADGLLYPDRYLGEGIVNKRRKGNDDCAEATRYFGDPVRYMRVLLPDDEVETFGSMFEAGGIMKRKGARSTWAVAYHGVLAGPAIDRLRESSIEKLIVTNTVPIPDWKIEQAAGKMDVVDISGFAMEAVRKWYAGESLKSVIEYAY